MINQYIAPELIELYRDAAMVMVEARTENAGVIVDSKSFGPLVRPIPKLGDNVRLPEGEGSWRRARFVPPGSREGSLTDPADLIVVGHAGCRVLLEGGITGTICSQKLGLLVVITDCGRERMVNLDDSDWEYLTRSAQCQRCKRIVSIYTPSLLCGGCAGV